MSSAVADNTLSRPSTAFSQARRKSSALSFSLGSISMVKLTCPSLMTIPETFPASVMASSDPGIRTPERASIIFLSFNSLDILEINRFYANMKKRFLVNLRHKPLKGVFQVRGGNLYVSGDNKSKLKGFKINDSGCCGDYQRRQNDKKGEGARATCHGTIKAARVVAVAHGVKAAVRAAARGAKAVVNPSGCGCVNSAIR